VYNAADDTEMKMGDWFDLVADTLGLRRPPRISREAARNQIPAAALAFMQESRRLDNTRLKSVLGIRLRYPTVREGLRNEYPAGLDQPA
jgi:nucleoside-diphosphate-sugar epimerase